MLAPKDTRAHRGMYLRFDNAGFPTIQSSASGVSSVERFRLIVSMLLVLASCLGHSATVPEHPWLTTDDPPQVVLYFFWTSHCPYCLNARPFVQTHGKRHPWLVVRELELTTDPDNVELYVSLTRLVGQRPGSVPAFLFCGEMLTGFDHADGVGKYLEGRLIACRDAGGPAGATTVVASEAVPLPVLGAVDLSSWSLPVLAITLGALDSFNPCAFFVLLFLLTLLVHARSRRRMLLVGGLFVLVSGVLYFLFMAAWLNLFMLIGELPLITLAAGVIAIAMGLVNVKDFVSYRHGISLSIPEAARPVLFARVRRLISAERLPTLIVGTLALAVAANIYELLCTAGFPMVFTRVLTLNELGTGAYYGYLALYATVYVVPLFAIVAAFAISLGGRRLTEHQGRLLKLLSGTMMLGLGGVLVLAPELLGNVLVAVALVPAAVLVTVAAHYWSRRRLPSHMP